MLRLLATALRLAAGAAQDAHTSLPAGFRNRSDARLRLFGSCTINLHSGPPWKWARRDCRPTTRVAAATYFAPDWHVFAVAKAGSSRLKAWSERFNEERGHADRLPVHHANFTLGAATSYEAARSATFVRDPFERLASGALELLKARGGLLVKTPAAAERLAATIGHGYRPLPGEHGAEPRGYKDWGVWERRVNAFARSLVRDDLNGSLGRRGRVGWAPVNGHVSHQAVYLARACPRVAYIGDMLTNVQELDALFGRRPTDQRPVGVSRSSRRPPHVFPDDVARDICRFYLVDFCCLDVTYRRRCEALGVFCPADMVFHPPPPPPGRGDMSSQFDAERQEFEARLARWRQKQQKQHECQNP